MDQSVFYCVSHCQPQSHRRLSNVQWANPNEVFSSHYNSGYFRGRLNLDCVPLMTFSAVWIYNADHWCLTRKVESNMQDREKGNADADGRWKKRPTISASEELCKRWPNETIEWPIDERPAVNCESWKPGPTVGPNFALPIVTCGFRTVSPKSRSPDPVRVRWFAKPYKTKPSLIPETLLFGKHKPPSIQSKSLLPQVKDKAQLW